MGQAQLSPGWHLSSLIPPQLDPLSSGVGSKTEILRVELRALLLTSCRDQNRIFSRNLTREGNLRRIWARNLDRLLESPEEADWIKRKKNWLLTHL